MIIFSFDKGAVRTFDLNDLKNIGNPCFMSSVIQYLSNTR